MIELNRDVVKAKKLQGSEQILTTQPLTVMPGTTVESGVPKTDLIVLPVKGVPESFVFGGMIRDN